MVTFALPQLAESKPDPEFADHPQERHMLAPRLHLIR